MGKSIIPFIFDSSCLNSIFIEASTNKKISNVFRFQVMKSENLDAETSRFLLTDYPFFKKIMNKELKIGQIFLIGELNNLKSETLVNTEVIKINLPLRMHDVFQRIENKLLQVNNHRERLIKYKYFTYDPSTRELSNKLFSLRLTEKESQIFICLIENSEPHISKKDLLQKVWSYGEGIDTHTLETHVYALRKKIEMKLKMKDLIMFEEKKGYYLNKSIL